MNYFANFSIVFWHYYYVKSIFVIFLMWIFFFFVFLLCREVLNFDRPKKYRNFCRESMTQRFRKPDFKNAFKIQSQPKMILSENCQYFPVEQKSVKNQPYGNKKIFHKKFVNSSSFKILKICSFTHLKNSKIFNL